MMNPLAMLQSKVSEFVTLLVEIREYGAAEKLTPWVREACREFPFISAFIMQPPEQLLDWLERSFPALRARITDRDAAIKTLAELQARLRAPDPGLRRRT